MKIEQRKVTRGAQKGAFCVIRDPNTSTQFPGREGGSCWLNQTVSWADCGGIRWSERKGGRGLCRRYRERCCFSYSKEGRVMRQCEGNEISSYRKGGRKESDPKPERPKKKITD